MPPAARQNLAALAAMEELKRDRIVRRSEVVLPLLVATVVLIADAGLWTWWLVDRPAFVEALAAAREHVRPLWQAIPGRREFMLTARLEAHPDAAHMVGGLFLANAIILLSAFPVLTATGIAIATRVRRQQPAAASAPGIRWLSWSCVLGFALILTTLDSYEWAGGAFRGASFAVTYLFVIPAGAAALAWTWPICVIVLLGSLARTIEFVRDTT